MLFRKNQTVRVKCYFKRGGLPNEREFFVPGNVAGEYFTGVASLIHCLDTTGKPLPYGRPPEGETCEGYLNGAVVRHDKDRSIVLTSLPNGDVAEIGEQHIHREGEHVPDESRHSMGC